MHYGSDLRPIQKTDKSGKQLTLLKQPFSLKSKTTDEGTSSFKKVKATHESAASKILLNLLSSLSLREVKTTGAEAPNTTEATLEFPKNTRVL